MMSSLLLLAAAQGLHEQWMDRVTHDALQAKGPLPTRPVHHTLHLGALGVYETNVNLEEKDEDGESMIVPFLGLRVEYSERQVDAAFDGLLNWKQYIPDDELSDDEERLYGRVRYLSPKLELEAFEVFRHLSDPVDVVFADRVDRIVSDTIGRGRFELFGGFAAEVDVDFGIVRYLEKTFDDGDNWNLRAGGGFSARVSMGMEAVAQAGVMMVDYRYSTGAPPDVEGTFVRAGVRGDLMPTLSLTLLLGAAQAESDDFSSGAEGTDEEAGEADVHLRWEASPTLTIYGDYTRRLTFGGGLEPFQVVNRLVALAELQATKDFLLRGRAELDHADGAFGIERDWAAVAGSLQWQSHPQVFFDVGLEYRWGEVGGAAVGYDYDDVIVHAGIVITN